MSNTHLVCTALVGTNKVGNLKKDEDGYYTIVLGALNSFNSAGAYYPAAGVESVFADSSSLQRRIKTGNCRGEYGHPYRHPGQSIQEYMARCVKIQEDNIAFHIAEVWLDDKSVKGPDGKPVVAVIARIKPCGPRGYVLEQQLQNPNENVCFSVRALTVDTMVNGIMQKVIKQIITWDYVNEPGISVATKYNSPSLECFEESSLLVTAAMIDSFKTPQYAGISFESAQVTMEEISSIVKAAGGKKTQSKRPASANW